MAYRIRYAPTSKESLDDAFAFLDGADATSKASRRLFAELKEVKGYLAVFPNMYAIREDESRSVGHAVRAAQVGGHLLYYVVLDQSEEVVFYLLRHRLADPDAMVWPSLDEN